MAIPEGLIAWLWTLLTAVLAPTVLGIGVVRALGLSRTAGRRVQFAWAYLTGQLLQAAITFAWLAADKPVPGLALPAFAVVLGTALARWGARREANGSSPSLPPLRGDRVLRWITTALALLLIERMLRVGAEPLLDGDDADIWAAKAKVLWSAHGLQLDFASAYVRHPAYPLQNPLAQVLAFAANGRVLLWENRLPIQCFGLALLLLLSAALERATSRWLAAALLVAFASTSFVQWSATAYSDVLLAFGWFAAFDAALRWWATRERVWWRLACCALAVVLAAKNEGSMLVVAAAAATGAVALWPAARAAMPWPGRALGWLAVPLAAALAGQAFNAHFGLRTDLTDPLLNEGRGLLGQIAHFFTARWWIVLRHYGGLLLGSGEGRLVLAMLLAPLAVAARERARPRLVPWLATVLAVAGYMAVFIGTNANVGGPEQGLLWHLYTAADRTLLHVLPTAVLAIALHLQRRPSGELA